MTAFLLPFLPKGQGTSGVVDTDISSMNPEDHVTLSLLTLLLISIPILNLTAVLSLKSLLAHWFVEQYGLIAPDGKTAPCKAKIWRISLYCGYIPNLPVPILMLCRPTLLEKVVLTHCTYC